MDIPYNDLVQRVQFGARHRADEASRFNAVLLLECFHRSIGLIVESTGYFASIEVLKSQRHLQSFNIFKIRGADLQVMTPLVAEARGWSGRTAYCTIEGIFNARRLGRTRRQSSCRGYGKRLGALAGVNRDCVRAGAHGGRNHEREGGSVEVHRTRRSGSAIQGEGDAGPIVAVEIGAVDRDGVAGFYRCGRN